MGIAFWLFLSLIIDENRTSVNGNCQQKQRSCFLYFPFSFQSIGYFLYFCLVASPPRR